MDMSDNTLLEVKNISKSYPDLHTLEDISLKLGKNQFTSVLGPSGCGKSTVFNIISGLELPDMGTVLINGKDFNGKTGKISYMHQKDLLLPWKNILDNVCLPLFIKGAGLEEAHRKAIEYFPDFGLEGFEKKFPYQLSGGMRQRTALLRTYLFADDIMLLDEPFGSLDAITRWKMQGWLLGLFEKLDASILFITHDIDEAIFLSDRIYLLSRRPAVVRNIFDIDIERQRNEKILTSARFNRLKEEILKLL